MTTQQPRWKRIANLGDVNPVKYGGYFVYHDLTGVYEAEAEYLETPEDETGEWRLYRIVLDRCTYINGVLSDNKFHPELPAWFANPDHKGAAYTIMGDIAAYVGIPAGDLISALCGADPIPRADVYRSIAEYHGWENFDNYPRTYRKRSELPRRIRRSRS